MATAGLIPSLGNSLRNTFFGPDVEAQRRQEIEGLEHQRKLKELQLKIDAEPTRPRTPEQQVQDQINAGLGANQVTAETNKTLLDFLGGNSALDVRRQVENMSVDARDREKAGEFERTERGKSGDTQRTMALMTKATELQTPLIQLLRQGSNDIQASHERMFNAGLQNRKEVYETGLNKVLPLQYLTKLGGFVLGLAA